MLYVWMGLLKADAGPVPQEVQQQVSEFLSQPFITVRYAGQLLDSAGRRSGMLMIFEHDSREAAEAFVEGSPYRRAGLYATDGLYEYRDEVG